MPYNSGDRFHCGGHRFSTNDQSEWKKHEAEEIHTQNGSALCNYCGMATSFSFTGKKLRQMSPAVCNNCRQEIEGVKQNLGL